MALLHILDVMPKLEDAAEIENENFRFDGISLLLTVKHGRKIPERTLVVTNQHVNIPKYLSDFCSDGRDIWVRSSPKKSRFRVIRDREKSLFRA